MDIKEFYSNPELEDGFGSTMGDRANPHRGLDFPHSASTPIPTYSGGTVVLNEWSNALGWIVEVLADNGRYIGFRHMRSRSQLGIGARVEFADIIGPVGNTGSASRGNHLCTTNASGKGGVYGNANLVSDPWPYIYAAVNAGGAAVAPLPAPIPQEDEMTNHYYADNMSANGRVGAGYIYAQDAEGPLRALNNLEGSAVLEKVKQGKATLIHWNGDDIWTLSTFVGMRKYEPLPAGAKMSNGTLLAGPGRMTGEIIYGDHTAFPKVEVAK